MTYSRKLAAALAASVCVVAIATPAQAQVRHFNIGAGSLKSALDAYARQSGRQVIYKVDEVRSARSKGAKGSMSADDALDAVLAGSGFAARKDASGALAIVRAPAAVASGEGQAGSAPAGDESANENERGTAEILVVGSKSQNIDIRRSENDPQPYVVFDSADIQRSGATNVEDFLKQRVTANTVSQTASQGFSGELGTNGGNSSIINLRGLGANKTLVLVDGRRVAASFGSSTIGGQPDINGIPLASIDRIEVLPASASAIYGGVAMGGVVNIILKRDFKGGEIRASYDDTFKGRSPRRTIGANYGISLFDGNTNIEISGEYSDGDPLLLRDRSSIVAENTATLLKNNSAILYTPTLPFMGASPNIASGGTAITLVPPGTPGANCLTPAICLLTTTANLTLKNGTPLNSPITFVPVGTAPGASLSPSLLANAGRYNLELGEGTGPGGLLSEFGIVPTIYSGSVTIRQNLFNNIKLFADLRYSRNEGSSLYNPFGVGVLRVPAASPANPFNQPVIVRTPTQVDTRFTAVATTKSAAVGVIIPIRGTWAASVDYNWSQNRTIGKRPASDSTTLTAALSNGTLNPFVDTVQHPLDLDRYVWWSIASGTQSLDDVVLRFSGTLFRLPAGPAKLTIGLEHRRESFTSRTQSLFPSTPASNTSQDFAPNSQNVDSAYGEALIPILAGGDGTWNTQAVDLQLAGRFERYRLFRGPTPGASNQSDYREQFSKFSPTIALKYQPFSFLTFRGSYAAAFLPPAISQLSPSIISGAGTTNIADPVLNQAYLTTVSPHGNPNLKPQTSTSTDFGVIVEPRTGPLKGLRLNVEYYRIKQPNIIVSPSVQQIILEPSLAEFVHRDPVTNRITLLESVPVNANLYRTYGWDATLGFEKSTAIGRLGVSSTGTWISHDYRQFTFNGPTYDYVTYVNDGGVGRFKGNTTIDWSSGRWGAAWTATYYSGYKQLGSPGSPSALQGVNNFVVLGQGSDRIASQIYHDLYISYRIPGRNSGGDGFVRSALANTSIEFVFHNIFNTKPPFDAQNSPYFYSGYGDIRLRSWRIVLRKSF